MSIVLVSVPDCLSFYSVTEKLLCACVCQGLSPNPPCESHDTPFSWMSPASPILLIFCHLNFSPLLFTPFSIIPLPSVFSHALPFPVTLVHSVPRFFKGQSIKQSNVLISWCPCDQRPRSLWTWVPSRISGPAVSTSGWMMTRHMILPMIMRTNSIHLVKLKDSIQKF